MKNIVMVIASNEFRDIEYIVPRAFFEQHGFEVAVCSSARVATGKHGYVVKSDFLVEDLEPEKYIGIFLVGGKGALEYQNNSALKTKTEVFIQTGKPVGAICAAPRNLLKWGILESKKVTGNDWDGQFESFAQQFNAEPHKDEKVIVQDNILTANGPEAAEQSALEFMKLIEKSR